MKMKADGDRITTDPEVAPASFDFLRAAELTPAETAMLLLGLPPRDDVPVEVAATGLASATRGRHHGRVRSARVSGAAAWS